MSDDSNTKSPELRLKNKKLMYLLLIPVVVLMFGFTYVQVPMFRLFCQKIGFGISPLADIKENPTGRMVKVLYTGVTAGNLPVYFRPKESIQRVEVGRSFENFYRFVNMSKDSVYFRPVHSILPEDAAKKFTMTKCFCFDDQILAPGEEKSFPIVSILDSSLNREIEQVTLHYTLFEKDPETMETGRGIPNVVAQKTE